MKEGIKHKEEGKGRVKSDMEDEILKSLYNITWLCPSTKSWETYRDKDSKYLHWGGWLWKCEYYWIC